MKCNIKYIDNNKDVSYWCLSHKSIARSQEGIPTSCECKYKERYENIVKMEKQDINSIKIVYPDLKKDTNVKLYINDKEFNGILQIENSIIDLKDYGGLMLSKLNNVNLETSSCKYCSMKHTDNGKFAYTKHSTHLCIYCGHLYDVEKANIGNELALYFDFPNINLKDNVVVVGNKCELVYDIFKGNLTINGTSCDKLVIDNNEISLVEYLNSALKDEY